MLKSLLAATAAVFVLAACAGTSETAAPAAPPSETPAAPERSLTQISGDVYRYQDNQHFGLVLVTSEGIVLADPINRAAAEWLKGELATRFPDNKVTHVLYSHHHYDHVSGAAAFPDARVIAQADAVTSLKPPPDGAPLEGFIAGLDTNGDGMLQQTEADANFFVAPQFPSFDINGDGNATGNEIWTAQYGDVRVPDGTFKNDYTLMLGGQSIDMIHVGGTHASDMVYMMFPGKILFVVDLVNIKRLPFGNLADYDLDENFAMIDRAIAMEPAIISPGHGLVGTPEDLVQVRQYFTDLIDGVQAGIDAGKSLEEIQASLTLEPYKDWQNYEAFRTQNIAGVYAKLTAN